MTKKISHLAPFGLRIPEELKAQLEKSSKQAGRSLNSEMVTRLSESYRQPLGVYSDGELISELMSRYPKGEIYIRVGRRTPEDTEE